MENASSPSKSGHKRSRSAVLKSIVLPNSFIASPSKKSPNKSRPQSVALPSQPMLKDKRNTTPPATAATEAPTPIWAEFTSQASYDPFTSPTRQVDSNTKDLPGFDKSPPKQWPISDAAIQSPVRRSNHSKHSSSSAASSYMSNASSVSLTPRVNAATLSLVERQRIEADFEAILAAQNIPENMRQNMRSLDISIKADFIRHAKPKDQKPEPAEPPKSSFWESIARGRSRSVTKRENVEDDYREAAASPSKRSRSRGRTFTLTKGEQSPRKRSRSNSRPRSLMRLKNLSSSSINSLGVDGTAESKDAPETLGTNNEDGKDNLRRPADFVSYLTEQSRPQTVEVGKLHKLRILLRNETVSWVDTFILKGGMTQLLRLFEQIRQIEWREEHDDLVLHETLLCLKGLCTTERALNQLASESDSFFPNLLNMLFDEERKGPSEFNTRGVVMSLLYTHLSTVPGEGLKERAATILAYLSDPSTPDDAKPVGFILNMQQRRPYQRWCKEISNVTKEVFWIFLHHHNVISVEDPAQVQPDESYSSRHFPKARPPVPAASWVGGVEWEASNYLATHLDLMNGLIASMPSKRERDLLRRDLKASGFEKIMGVTLRTCKEKFYGAIHDGLRTYIAAAWEDDWPATDIQNGPPQEERSPSKSPKKHQPPPPQLQLPKLDLGGIQENQLQGDDWI